MTCHTETLPAALIGQLQMDREDLARALEDLHPANFTWALGCCRRNRDDAEEVLQTVYVMVLDGRAQFDGRSALKTWLFGVIRRVALAHARRRWLREKLIAKWFRANDTVEASSELVENSELTAALARLPRRQREVLDLVFYHEMTVDQAAAVMQISCGSARVHYDRAKKRMREILGVRR